MDIDNITNIKYFAVYCDNRKRLWIKNFIYQHPSITDPVKNINTIYIYYNNDIIHTIPEIDYPNNDITDITCSNIEEAKQIFLNFIYKKKLKIALLLRGHERHSFDDNKLFNMIDILIKKYDIDIYIHTWNIRQTNISWRYIKQDNDIIDKDKILSYFCNHKNKIKHIIIDNDNINDELIGDVNGKICNGPSPKIGWKKMWYGKLKIIEYIKNNDNIYDLILNTRFDLFNNSNNIFDINKICYNIDLLSKPIDKIYFLSNNECCGIDNFYMSSIDKMYKLIKIFHYNLDDIIKKYPNIIHQEFLVFYEGYML